MRATNRAGVVRGDARRARDRPELRLVPHRSRGRVRRLRRVESNVYRDIVGARTIAEIGGALWEGSETASARRCGKASTPRSSPAWRHRPASTSSRGCVRARRTIHASGSRAATITAFRVARRRSRPGSSRPMCWNTPANTPRPTRYCCCRFTSGPDGSRTRRIGRPMSSRAGRSAVCRAGTPTAGTRRSMIELLPHGFAVGFSKQF